MSDEMKYDRPILSDDHALFCRAEAERRYEGRMYRNVDGMLLIEDGDDLSHTDAVLRALSFHPALAHIPRETDDGVPIIAASDRANLPD
jgi:hypothetical protein